MCICTRNLEMAVNHACPQCTKMNGTHMHKVHCRERLAGEDLAVYSAIYLALLIGLGLGFRLSNHRF